MPGRYFIYGLKDPRTDQVRYIGKSETGLTRPNNHTSPSFLKRRCRKSSWLLSLLRSNFRPSIVILEEAEDRADLNSMERFWIAQGLGLAWPLTNMTKGGDGGAMGPEAVEKIRAKKIGRAPWNKGRPASAETKHRLQNLRRGSKASVATRLKMSASQKGNRYAAKLSIDEVQKIRTLLSLFVKQATIAEMVGINKAQVSRIKTGKAHGGVPLEP